jgi:transcriptional regulator with XRE-family HTH domain
MSDVSQIDGSVVRLRREAQGWAINDVAARACLSVKQIRQIEEGGLSSFYSENVKLTAAKKVAALLQLSEAQLFGQVPLYPPQAQDESFLFEPKTEAFQMAGFAAAETPMASSGVHLSRSEPLHFLAQPPEVESTAESQVEETPKVQDTEKVLASALPLQGAQVDKAETPSPSSNYFLKILVLFLVAIAVAALLRPKNVEPNPATPEAATGQSMTSTVAAPPVDGVAPPEAASELPAEAAKGSVEAKPAAAAGAER